MANLTYRQIEAFRAVMISGTTSGAADILCVSQPAVSRHLKLLRQAQVILERRERQWIYFRLNPDHPQHDLLLTILNSMEPLPVSLPKSC